MKSKNTYKLALASVICALCVVALFLGSVLTVLDLSCAAICSIAVTLVVIESGGIYPWFVWLGTSILGLLLCPDKFGSVTFLVFCGYYPMIKLYIEKIKSKIIQWILKTVIFNIALSVIITASLFILGLPETEITYSLAVYVLCNITFIIFDIALTRLISMYLFRLRDRFFKHK